MNPQAPFLASDLEELDARLLSRADAVVPMRDVYKGNTGENVIALRHDVDDNAGSLDTALALAEWEHDRGYRSTYFLLHDSHYWGDVRDACRQLAELGHEVGLHVNCIAEAIRQQRDPYMILIEALHSLRICVPVIGVVAHGDALCHRHGFVNDEIFQEARRPSYGAADRTIEGVKLEPRSLWEFGLKYDANWLPRGDYLSDSGGRWSQPFDEVVDAWPSRGQLAALVHPDWWSQAFVAEAVAA